MGVTDIPVPVKRPEVGPPPGGRSGSGGGECAWVLGPGSALTGRQEEAGEGNCGPGAVSEPQAGEGRMQVKLVQPPDGEGPGFLTGPKHIERWQLCPLGTSACPWVALLPYLCPATGPLSSSVISSIMSPEPSHGKFQLMVAVVTCRLKS